MTTMADQSPPEREKAGITRKDARAKQGECESESERARKGERVKAKAPESGSKTETRSLDRKSAVEDREERPRPRPTRSGTCEAKTEFQRGLPIGEGSAVPGIISDDRLPV